MKDNLAKLAELCFRRIENFRSYPHEEQVAKDGFSKPASFLHFFNRENPAVSKGVGFETLGPPGAAGLQLTSGVVVGMNLRMPSIGRRATVAIDSGQGSAPIAQSSA